MSAPESDFPGLTVEAARNLIAVHGSVDKAAAAGGFPIARFRRWCKAHNLKAVRRDRGGWGVDPDSRSGFVYFIRAVGQNLLKIGVAVEPQRRLADLQTGSWVELRLEATLWAEDALALEKKLHRRHRANHVRGEWFAFPEGQSVTAVFKGV